MRVMNHPRASAFGPFTIPLFSAFVSVVPLALSVPFMLVSIAACMMCRFRIFTFSVSINARFTNLERSKKMLNAIDLSVVTDALTSVSDSLVAWTITAVLSLVTLAIGWFGPTLCIFVFRQVKKWASVDR